MGGVVRVILGGVLDQILEAETVLLDPGHRLVQEILQRQRLTLLLTLQRPQLDRSCEVSELRIELAALVESLQRLGVVAEELSVDLGLLGEHLEVVADLVLSVVPVHLLLEVVMEVVMELVKFRDLEEDDLKVLPWYDWLRGAQGHFHRLHVLETNTETLEVDGLAVGDAVENVSVHQLSLRLTHTAAVAVVSTLVRAQRPAIAVAAAGVVVWALGTL